jgi:ubiquinone/menaquinone biosynthesis C-methylase UbiE
VGVTVEAETQGERDKRQRQRTLFDGVAGRYQESRPGYPGHVVDFVVSTAGLGAGSTVLEVGCGTGQLTERLASFGFALTAIDIGPAMIAVARQRLPDSGISFQVVSFEELAAGDACFDLVISGCAWHWIDPEVGFAKSARLLRPGGWLALLGIDERYDDPFGAALTGMWIARGDVSGAWVKRLSDAEAIAGTGLFGEPVQQADQQRITRRADAVIAVENTRATSLSWPDDVRQGFNEELRHHLRSQPHVHLSQHTSVTMAPVLRSRR